MKPNSGVSIPLTNRFWLTCDNLNWRISSRSVVDGFPVWKHVAYFPTIKAALQECYDLTLRTSGAETFEELEQTSMRMINSLTARFDYETLTEQKAESSSEL